MRFEVATDAVLRALLEDVEPQDGAVVEVGLGTADFSFLWAAPMGYRCVAVEPLAFPVLREQCAVHGVELVESALSDRAGTAELRIGRLDNGLEFPDVSSIEDGWWAAGTRTRVVPTETLPGLLSRLGIGTVVLLKLDVEGAEWRIVNTLQMVSAWQLPRVLCFEYGGGGRRCEQTGAWREPFFSQTLRSLRVIQQLGYKSAVLCERNAREVRVIEGFAQADPAQLFALRSEVGNLICTRNGFTDQTVVRLRDACRHALAQDRVEQRRLRREMAIAMWRMRLGNLGEKLRRLVGPERSG